MHFFMGTGSIGCFTDGYGLNTELPFFGYRHGVFTPKGLLVSRPISLQLSNASQHGSFETQIDQR